MGTLTDAPSGQTDFMGYTHEQLLAMFGTANPAHAFEAALKLGTAFQMLNDATTVLSTGINDLNWSGESADNFRTWSGQLIATTRHLADYSLDIGQTLLDVAQSIGSTKLPPIPTADIDLVETLSASPEALGAVAAFIPAEASKLATDFTRAQDNIENLRIEAASQMRKLAMGYDAAGRRMTAAVPPRFPPPPNIFEVPLVEVNTINIPVGDDLGDSGGTSRPKGVGADKPVTTGPTAEEEEGTAAIPLPVAATAIPPVTGSPVTEAEPGFGPASPAGVDLAGTGILTRPDAAPATAAPPPVPGGGSGPGIGGLPLPLNGLPGTGTVSGAKPAVGRPGVPGIAGGTASGTGRFGATPGNSGATPPGRPYSTGSTGTFGGRPIPGGTGGTTGGSAGARPYGRPGTGGIVGGQSVPGSNTAAPRGATGRPTPRAPWDAGGRTAPGPVGNRPFSPGGSGIRTDDTSARRRRRVVSGTGTTEPSPEERRRQRTDRLEEGDDTSTTQRPPVPPVVD